MRSMNVPVTLRPHADLSAVDRENDVSVISGVVDFGADIVGVLERLPGPSLGTHAVPFAVVVDGLSGRDGLEPSLRVRLVPAVMLHLEDSGADINILTQDDILYVRKSVAAGEVLHFAERGHADGGHVVEDPVSAFLHV